MNPARLKIKVCGMRDAGNIESLEEIGVDFMGLIFYEKSSRFVNGGIPEIATKKIGVFVNENEGGILQKTNQYGLSYVQLHGDETPLFCEALKNKKIKIIKAFRIDDEFDFGLLEEYEPHCEYFLFDAKGKEYGGNGIVFDWEILKKYKGRLPFFLSGGLDDKSIKAIRELNHRKLFAIDINSGFEIKPALKNIPLIRKFKNELDTVVEPERK